MPAGQLRGVLGGIDPGECQQGRYAQAVKESPSTEGLVFTAILLKIVLLPVTRHERRTIPYPIVNAIRECIAYNPTTH